LAINTAFYRPHPTHKRPSSVGRLIETAIRVRRLPASAGEKPADVLMNRYEKLSTIVTWNRPVDDWPSLLGDAVVVTPRRDRLMHHSHVLGFDSRSWRLKEAAGRVV